MIYICPNCKGKGIVIEKSIVNKDLSYYIGCYLCNGIGKIKETKLNEYNKREELDEKS